MAHTATATASGEVGGLRIETIRDGHVLRVALRGESDFSRLSELDHALGDIELDGARLVDLDLTHLVFADVATVRRLAAFAGHAKRGGQEVTTRGAHRTVRKVADLLQVHHELGLG